MGRKKLKKIETDTQPQLTRLHGLVKRIQRGDYPSQKILGAEWEKTPRTIQRDLDFIRDVWRLPLEYDVYRYGYYFSEPVAKFPMVQISEKELVSVFMAQKALTQFRGTPFEAPLRSAFEKLAGGLKGEISVAWEDLDSAISFRGIETNAGDMEVLQRLSAAIRGRYEIEFEYTKLQGAEGKGPDGLGNDEARGRNDEAGMTNDEGGPRTQSRRLNKLFGGVRGEGGATELRFVRPYHLANIGAQWYLFGFDLVRGAMRKFVPARMGRLRVSRRRFERPAGFSVDKLLKGSFGVFSGGEAMEMTVRFGRARAQIVRERKWHHSQRVREVGDGEVEVTFELSSFVEIVPWILGWGEHAWAVSPPGLVGEVRRVVEEVRARYENSQATGGKNSKLQTPNSKENPSGTK